MYMICIIVYIRYSFQAVEGRDKAVDLLEVTNADFRADLERWHVIKKQDMKKVISGIAERNITFYDEVGLITS